MKGYATAEEMAKRWNVSVRQVQILCRNGKIYDASMFANAWAIPDDTSKPTRTGKRYQIVYCNYAAAIVQPLVIGRIMQARYARREYPQFAVFVRHLTRSPALERVISRHSYLFPFSGWKGWAIVTKLLLSVAFLSL